MQGGERVGVLAHVPFLRGKAGPDALGRRGGSPSAAAATAPVLTAVQRWAGQHGEAQQDDCQDVRNAFAAVTVYCWQLALGCTALGVLSFLVRLC